MRHEHCYYTETWNELKNRRKDGEKKNLNLQQGAYLESCFFTISQQWFFRLWVNKSDLNYVLVIISVIIILSGVNDTVVSVKVTSIIPLYWCPVTSIADRILGCFFKYGHFLPHGLKIRQVKTQTTTSQENSHVFLYFQIILCLLAFCDENYGFGTVNAFEKCKNHPKYKCAI